MAGSTPGSPIAEAGLGHAAVAAPGRARSLTADAWRRFRRHRLALVGICVLGTIAAVLVFGPLVWRTPIDEIDFKAKLRGPTPAHPLGTDDLGQDLLARTLHGGRISLAVGVTAMLIALSVGVMVGALAGYYGGVADHALMRDRKSTRLNSSHLKLSRMPSSA